MKSQAVVLVAEDDPVFRRVIAFSLVAGGFQCLTASNGQEAFAIVEQSPVDLIVTDHQMPICSGLELIEKVRQSDFHKQLPIVLCTAKGFELNATQLIQAYGLLAVMRKPFSPRQMIALITEYLHSIPDPSTLSANEDVGTAALETKAAPILITSGYSHVGYQTAVPHA